MARINVGGSGGGGGGGGSSAKPKPSKGLPPPPWLDPNYGYKVTPGKKNELGVVTTKPTKKYQNPAQVGERLGQTQIQGVNAALYGPTGPQGAPMENRPMTVDQATYVFQNLLNTPGGAQRLASIQQQMYFAGLYGKKDQPILGTITQKDVTAWKHMIIGLASSPGQADLGTYLNQISTAGQQTGTAGGGGGGGGATRAPLVIKHVDDSVLSTTFQSAAQQLLGQLLPSDKLNQMIQAYHQNEDASQTTAYNLRDPQATGTIEPGAGGTVSTTPSPGDYAASQIQAQNPGQYAVNSFGSKVMSALDSLRTSGYLPGAG